MAYLSDEQVAAMGFAHVGRNVRISDRAAIYECEKISIGDNSRIDDFCVVAGRVTIGRNVHLTVFNNVEGGRPGVTIGDFSTLAYGCHVVAQSDDYSGRTMVNSTIPAAYKQEVEDPVVIERQVILGTGCVVLPGVTIAEGTSGGARSLFLESTEPWSIYVGSPARRIKARSRDLLALEARFLAAEE